MYGHTLVQEPLPRGNEIYNFGRLFLSHHYFILSLSDLCLGVKKRIFKGSTSHTEMKVNHRFEYVKSCIVYVESIYRYQKSVQFLSMTKNIFDLHLVQCNLRNNTL